MAHSVGASNLQSNVDYTFIESVLHRGISRRFGTKTWKEELIVLQKREELYDLYSCTSDNFADTCKEIDASLEYPYPSNVNELKERFRFKLCLRHDKRNSAVAFRATNLFDLARWLCIDRGNWNTRGLSCDFELLENPKRACENDSIQRFYEERLSRRVGWQHASYPSDSVGHLQFEPHASGITHWKRRPTDDSFLPPIGEVSVHPPVIGDNKLTALPTNDSVLLEHRPTQVLKYDELLAEHYIKQPLSAERRPQEYDTASSARSVDVNSSVRCLEKTASTSSHPDSSPVTRAQFLGTDSSAHSSRNSETQITRIRLPLLGSDCATPIQHILDASGTPGVSGIDGYGGPPGLTGPDGHTIFTQGEDGQPGGVGCAGSPGQPGSRGSDGKTVHVMLRYSGSKQRASSGSDLEVDEDPQPQSVEIYIDRRICFIVDVRPEADSLCHQPILPLLISVRGGCGGSGGNGGPGGDGGTGGRGGSNGIKPVFHVADTHYWQGNLPRFAAHCRNESDELSALSFMAEAAMTVFKGSHGNARAEGLFGFPSEASQFNKNELLYGLALTDSTTSDSIGIRDKHMQHLRSSAKPNWFFHAGDGGSGGQGGQGGRGGNAGNGGNGGSVIVETEDPRLLMFIECDVNGGAPGNPGLGGPGGNGGEGGPPGHAEPGESNPLPPSTPESSKVTGRTLIGNSRNGQTPPRSFVSSNGALESSTHSGVSSIGCQRCSAMRSSGSYTSSGKITYSLPSSMYIYHSIEQDHRYSNGTHTYSDEFTDYCPSTYPTAIAEDDIIHSVYLDDKEREDLYLYSHDKKKTSWDASKVVLGCWGKRGTSGPAGLDGAKGHAGLPGRIEYRIPLSTNHLNSPQSDPTTSTQHESKMASDAELSTAQNRTSTSVQTDLLVPDEPSSTTSPQLPFNVYNQRYEVTVMDFQVTGEDCTGFHRPNESLQISNVQIVNSGPLPLPSGAKLTFLSSTTTVTVPQKQAVYLPALAPGEEFTIHHTFSALVCDFASPCSPGPFHDQGTLISRVCLLNREFIKGRCEKRFTIKHPLRLLNTSLPKTASPSDTIALRFSLLNESNRAYGGMACDPREQLEIGVRLDRRVFPIEPASVSHITSQDDTIWISFPTKNAPDTFRSRIDAILFSALEHSGGQSAASHDAGVNFGVWLQVERDVELFEKLPVQIEVYLGSRLIQYEHLYVRTIPNLEGPSNLARGSTSRLDIRGPSPQSVKAHASALLITSPEMTRREFLIWHSVLCALGLNDYHTWDTDWPIQPSDHVRAQNYRNALIVCPAYRPNKLPAAISHLLFETTHGSLDSFESGKKKSNIKNHLGSDQNRVASDILNPEDTFELAFVAVTSIQIESSVGCTKSEDGRKTIDRAPDIYFRHPCFPANADSPDGSTLTENENPPFPTFLEPCAVCSSSSVQIWTLQTNRDSGLPDCGLPSRIHLHHESNVSNKPSVILGSGRRSVQIPAYVSIVSSWSQVFLILLALMPTRSRFHLIRTRPERPVFYLPWGEPLSISYLAALSTQVYLRCEQMYGTSCSATDQYRKVKTMTNHRLAHAKSFLRFEQLIDPRIPFAPCFLNADGNIQATYCDQCISSRR
ncbi:unnamed protein product [Dicrocoelium dendriticum]|nr:unnamed protein product [Dicrocoelium dendriticum]